MSSYDGRTCLWSSNFTRFAFVGYNLKISYLRHVDYYWLIVIKVKANFFLVGGGLLRCSCDVRSAVVLLYWLGDWCPTSLDSVVVSSFRVDLQWRRKKLDTQPLKMRQLRCLETSASVHQVTLSNIPEEKGLSINLSLVKCGVIRLHIFEVFLPLTFSKLRDMC